MGVIVCIALNVRSVIIELTSVISGHSHINTQPRTCRCRSLNSSTYVLIDIVNGADSDVSSFPRSKFAHGHTTWINFLMEQTPWCPLQRRNRTWFPLLAKCALRFSAAGSWLLVNYCMGSKRASRTLRNQNLFIMLAHLSLAALRFDILLLATLVTVLLISYLRRAKKQPPGPFGWPVVGNILRLSLKGTWKSLTEFKNTYGTFWLYSRL